MTRQEVMAAKSRRDGISLTADLPGADLLYEAFEHAALLHLDRLRLIEALKPFTEDDGDLSPGQLVNVMADDCIRAADLLRELGEL